MASSYTDNSGIELIGVGEQSGTWGTTTNNNLETIDKALNGVTDVAVSGDMNITVTDGDKTSNGHTRVLKLTGSLGGSAAALTIAPDTREAFYIVHNTSGGALTFKQRASSGGEVTIANNAKGFIYADGKGSGAANVIDLLDGAAGNLDMLAGTTSATATTIADADRLIVNDNGTMVQAAVTDIKTYVNANLVEVPTALNISGTTTLTPSGAQSVYQRVTVASGSQTLRVAVTNLLAGQYVIIDKTTSANSLTLDWDINSAVSSEGLTLGASVEFAIGIFNGSAFSFTETVKF